MALEIASPGRALLGARGRAALSFQKLHLGVALAALTLAACDGPAPPMLRGPDGGVLTFDAAMIDVEPADARAVQRLRRDDAARLRRAPLRAPLQRRPDRLLRPGHAD